jgi:hypothetical protein
MQPNFMQPITDLLNSFEKPMGVIEATRKPQTLADLIAKLAAPSEPEKIVRNLDTRKDEPGIGMFDGEFSFEVLIDATRWPAGTNTADIDEAVEKAMKTVAENALANVPGTGDMTSLEVHCDNYATVGMYLGQFCIGFDLRFNATVDLVR